MRPSCTIRTTSNAKLPVPIFFVSAAGIIVSYSCVHRVTIGRLRVCVGSILAFYQIRDENREKFKLSYSCVHRVSKWARYDASIKDRERHQNLRHAKECPKDTRRFNFVLNSCVHLGLLKAIERSSYKIGTATSYFCRVIIGTIG